MHVVLLLLECDIYPSIGTTPLFTRWPEQSVLGQQTLVSGHLEFSLKNCFFEQKGFLCVGRTRHETDLTRGRKRLHELI